MATDLGLRIGDFIALKKTDLPALDQEPPISFEIMTTKEGVLAYGFLSQETVDLLKVYLPTLERKNGNPYLFPSNGNRSISDEWLNKLLQRLAEKAKINLNGKCISFHCFRKMFLSASIDSGIGLTAGKKLCGKAIAQSDDTYLTTVNLRQKFIQLKKFLNIKELPRLDIEKIEPLKNAINKLQSDLTEQKTITDVISEENQKIKRQLDEKGTELDLVKSELVALGNMIKQIANSDNYKGMADKMLDKVADELMQNPEFMAKFKIEAEKIKSGYFRPSKK
jgi:hypothetical protein